MSSYIVVIWPVGGPPLREVVEAPSSVAAALRSLQRHFPGDGPERFSMHVCPDYCRNEELRRINAMEAVGTACPRCADRGTDDDRACECDAGEPYRRSVAP
jgi:hypothetical protein